LPSELGGFAPEMLAIDSTWFRRSRAFGEGISRDVRVNARAVDCNWTRQKIRLFRV